MAKSTVAVRFTGEGSGLQGTLGALDAKMGGFGQKLATAAGPAGLAIAGVASAAVGVGAALFKVGSDFDEQFDKIRVGTGATGDALKGLEGSFKKVFGSTATDMESAGTAIADLNTRLGLTGKPLEALSQQFLNLARITGSDVKADIESVTGLFNQFGIAAEQQGPRLDELYRASQATGIGVQEMTDQMSYAGPVLRDLGFNFEQSTTLVARLAKAGLQINDVLPAMSRALATGAKEGKSAQQVFKDTFDAIKAAPDDTAAAGIALDVFGAKAGPKLAGLIREGRFSLEDLQKAIVDGKDTINQSAEDTEDFGEKWEKIKNRVLVGLEPVATKVFNAVGTAMDKLGPIIDNDIVPAFNRLSLWWQQNGPGIEKFVSQVFGTITQVIQAAVAVISFLWDHFGSTILASVKGIFNGIKDEIQGAMEIIRGIIDTITALIHGDWSGVWNGIKEIFAGVWNAMKGIVEQVMAVIHGVISAGWTTIKGVFTGALNGIKSAVSSAFSDIVKFFKDLPGNMVKALGDLSKLLVNAGKAVMKGLLDGIKAGFEGVKHFVGGIAHTISSLKGPLEYDAVLLNPHGNAIMQSLLDGLQAKYGPMLDFVSQVAARITSEVQGALASVPSLPALAAGFSGNVTVSNTGGLAAVGAGVGAGPVSLTVNVTVQGNVTAEQNLIASIQDALEQRLRRNGPTRFAVGF